MALTIGSSAFASGGKIPPRYSKDGANVSPPLTWRDAPPGTQSYVLVVEDPDAPKGTFHHWVAYDIPPDRTDLPEGAGSGEQGAPIKMEVNDFGNRQYDGPQPPPRHGTHHYHFRLAALDVPHLEVPARRDVKAVWEAAQGHVLEEAEIVGTFER